MLQRLFRKLGDRYRKLLLEFDEEVRSEPFGFAQGGGGPDEEKDETSATSSRPYDCADDFPMWP